MQPSTQDLGMYLFSSKLASEMNHVSSHNHDDQETILL
jgi:hypothetical protein